MRIEWRPSCRGVQRTAYSGAGSLVLVRWEAVSCREAATTMWHLMAPPLRGLDLAGGLLVMVPCLVISGERRWCHGPPHARAATHRRRRRSQAATRQTEPVNSTSTATFRSRIPSLDRA